MYNWCWSSHSNENANTNDVHLNNSQSYPFNRILASSYFVEKELNSSTLSQNLLTMFKVRIGWHFCHYSCKVVLTYRVRLFLLFQIYLPERSLMHSVSWLHRVMQSLSMYLQPHKHKCIQLGNFSSLIFSERWKSVANIILRSLFEIHISWEIMCQQFQLTFLNSQTRWKCLAIIENPRSLRCGGFMSHFLSFRTKFRW